ncbi:PQQ-binding-like beta-propeller repeat protein [Halobaculum sp. MBLA0147]|uniref:outer membrane protein assembly factor BamB family protein n=1 Tax=Halobaculum sp. MBLA0147 TaxID=3079934 RepID=UPI003524D5A1
MRSYSRRDLLATVGAAVATTGVVGATRPSGETAEPRGRTTDRTAATAPPASGAPLYRYDATNTGVIDATGPTAPPTQLWRRRFDAGVYGPPAVVEDTCYVTTGDGRLRALDATTGERSWSVRAADRLLTTPAVGTTGVHLCNENRVVRSVTTAEGSDRWRVGDRFRGGGQTPPTLANGLVIGAGGDGRVFAFDTETGRADWVVTLPRIVTRPLATDGRRVYVPLDERLVAVDARRAGEPSDSSDEDGGGDSDGPTGPAVRSTSWGLGTDAPVRSGVAVGGGLVHVGTADELLAVRRESGEPRWRVETDSPVVGAPALTELLTVAATAGGAVVGLDPEVGAVRWRTALDGRVERGPVVADETVHVVRTDGTVVALSFDGTVQWRLDHDATVSTTPVVLDDRLYLADWDGTLTAYGSGN